MGFKGDKNIRKQRIVDLTFVKNTGNGTLILDQTSESTLTEYWVITCKSSAGGSTIFSVNGSKSNDHQDYLLSDGQYTSDGEEISFLIFEGNKNFVVGDQFEFRTWAGEIPGNGIDDDQNGFIDDIPVDQVKTFAIELRDYLRVSKPAYGEAVRSTKKFDSEAENMVKEAITSVKEKMAIS